MQLAIVFVLLMHGIPLPFGPEQRYRRGAIFDRAKTGRILQFFARPASWHAAIPQAKAR